MSKAPGENSEAEPLRPTHATARRESAARSVATQLDVRRAAAGAAPGTMPDVPHRPTWGVDEMHAWLQTTVASDGETLESKFDESLDTQLQKYVRGFADGPRGFDLDCAKVRFPRDADTLARLTTAIEVGAITGIVIEAYPDGAQLEAIAARLNAANPAAALRQLEREMLVDFYVQHFRARNGIVKEPDRRFVEPWGKLKWSRDPNTPLWKLFGDLAAHTGHHHFDADGFSTAAYWKDHATIYNELLPTCPTVQDALGTVSVVFASTQRDVPEACPIVGADGITALSQGQGLTCRAELAHKVDTLTPTEYLAFVTATSAPADAGTYPDQYTWQYLAAINDGIAWAFVGDSASGRLQFNCGGFSSDRDSRVRSVIR